MPPDPVKREALPDRSTPRLIMVEGVPWVSHEFHERFINEMDAENKRLREQYEALQRTWHKSIEALHLAVAKRQGLREALTFVESIAGNTGIGAPAACMRVADIAKTALQFDEEKAT